MPRKLDLTKIPEEAQPEVLKRWCAYMNAKTQLDNVKADARNCRKETNKCLAAFEEIMQSLNSDGE